MTDYKKRNTEILSELLWEKQINELKERGLSEEQLVHLFISEYDRDREAFSEKVQEVLESEKLEEVDQKLQEQIQNLEESLDKCHKIRKGVVYDAIESKSGEE